MHDGCWKMEAGRWMVDTGRWKLENWWWKLEDGWWMLKDGWWMLEGGWWKLEDGRSWVGRGRARKYWKRRSHSKEASRTENTCWCFAFNDVEDYRQPPAGSSVVAEEPKMDEWTQNTGSTSGRSSSLRISSWMTATGSIGIPIAVKGIRILLKKSQDAWGCTVSWSF